MGADVDQETAERLVKALDLNGAWALWILRGSFWVEHRHRQARSRLFSACHGGETSLKRVAYV